MAKEVKLPRLGQGMESGTIVKWLKSEGDAVEKGEALYELDTDKVTQEVESDFAGTLLRITVHEGEAEVGRTVAVIGDQGEQIPAEQEAGPAPAGAKGSDGGAPQSAEKPAEAPQREPERERGRQASAQPQADAPAQTGNGAQPQSGGRIKASPLARRIARERGIELSSLRGTGPEGRIVAEDVERAAAEPAATPSTAPPAQEVERVPLSSIRRTIARRLTEAWQAPVFQIAMSADMTRAGEVRRRLVERAGDAARPTVTDLLTKACAAALIRHREINARYADDAIELYGTANVGLAVAIPQGLIVPVIRNCEQKSVVEIAAARVDLVERARAGKLQQPDLADGTFTISNLGMYGVEQFTAVLNPPQAAILAVGAARETPVARDGELVVLPLMNMTLTCDHRAVDGATAAEFLGTVQAFLEEPGLML